MNILLLSNDAPGYYRFFNPLVKKLSNEGHQVDVAVDSKFSCDCNELQQLGLPVHEFSSFFAKHETDFKILDRYSKYNLNYALLSDFERAEIYRIWGKKDEDYFERLKSALLSFFECIFKKKNIDAVLYENVSNTFAYFAFYVCQEFNVQYVGLTASRLPGRFSITSDPFNDHKAIEETLQKIRNGEVKVDKDVVDWCVAYIDNIENVMPDYMRFNNLDNMNLFGRYFKFYKFKRLLTAIKHLFDNHYYSFQLGNPLNYSWQMVRRNIARKLKYKIVKNKYGKAREGERYLLYPLHFHPESSTSILAGTYLNEYEVIRNIAFSLPQGYKLYVKDHMSAFAYPSLDFYKKLISLPNVRLLAPHEPTKKLIKDSQAVITLTSTVGYEALLLNKRVFLFGHVFYKFHPNVVVVDNPADLYGILSSSIGRPLFNDEYYNLQFVMAYYLETFPGIVNMMGGEGVGEVLKVVSHMLCD